METQIPTHPHLKLVSPTSHTANNTTSTPDPQAEEFTPLPFYPWDTRPDTVPLDTDECATALHLGQGSLIRAAQLLKTAPHRLARVMRAHPNLARIQNEANELTVAHAHDELLQALSSDSDRRREWAATKILASRAAQSHPFAPAPTQPSTTQQLSLSAAGRSIVFRWRTDADDALQPPSLQPPSSLTIEHDPA